MAGAPSSTALTALAASSRVALARLQHLGTPVPDDESKPQFSYEDFSPNETLYLGTLFTWLELLEGTVDALGPAIAEMEANMESDSAKTAMLMPIGVWVHLSADAQTISSPETFAVAHEHAQEALAHLGQAAELISKGVVSGNATAISMGSGDIYLANDHVGALMAELPFERPKRHEIID